MDSSKRDSMVAAVCARREKHEQQVKSLFLSMTDAQRIELAEKVKAYFVQKKVFGVRRLAKWKIRDLCLWGLSVGLRYPGSFRVTGRPA